MCMQLYMSICIIHLCICLYRQRHQVQHGAQGGDRGGPEAGAGELATCCAVCVLTLAQSSKGACNILRCCISTPRPCNTLCVCCSFQRRHTQTHHLASAGRSRGRQDRHGGGHRHPREGGRRVRRREGRVRGQHRRAHQGHLMSMTRHRTCHVQVQRYAPLSRMLSLNATTGIHGIFMEPLIVDYKHIPSPRSPRPPRRWRRAPRAPSCSPAPRAPSAGSCRPSEKGEVLGLKQMRLCSGSLMVRQSAPQKGS